MIDNVVQVTIKCFENELEDKYRYQEYRVEIDKKISVIGLLKLIHDNIDPTLAYRNVKCHMGTCTACLMKINGHNSRACSVSISPGEKVTVEPADHYRPVRDLVVDFSQTY